MGAHKRRKWRVYQFLSAMGVVSSKAKAVELARSGRIKIDGKVVESLHFQFNPWKDRLTVDDRPVELKENRRYFIFNKPEGVLCTKRDIVGFFDLPADIKNSLSPVGRLDKDSSGLLIVTNDGRLAQRVLNPRTKRKKVYEVVVAGSFGDEHARMLRDGVWIKTVIDDRLVDYRTLPADVSVRSRGKNQTVVHISIIEGKKRQVRLMCEAVGFKVRSLRRIAIAKLKLGMLRPGKYEELGKDKIYGLLFE